MGKGLTYQLNGIYRSLCSR